MTINKIEFENLEMQIEKIESLSVALCEAVYSGNLECSAYEPAFILLNDLLHHFRGKISKLSKQNNEVMKK